MTITQKKITRKIKFFMTSKGSSNTGSGGQGISVNGEEPVDEWTDDYPIYLERTPEVLSKHGDGSTLPFDPENATGEDWSDFGQEIENDYYNLLYNMDDVDEIIADGGDFEYSVLEMYEDELVDAHARMMDVLNYYNGPREDLVVYENAVEGIEKYIEYKQNQSR